MISKCLLKKTASSFFVIMLLFGSLMSNQLRAQTGTTTISGVVLDETGLPIPGANVIEKGTKNSASTDFDGKYSIKVTGSKSVLVFSYIGYEDLPQTVGSKKTLTVSLKSKASQLNEVVVVGYGTVKKSDLTGAVATVSGADLKKVAVASVAESMTGRIAGVQVTTAEGSPDSDVKIRIRGGGSITQNSSPLIIVDGFPVTSMSDISPSDVENITVLKDASSTAIYGSRGANGVIIITTKSGKDNKIAVSYNGFYGAKTIANKIDVLGAEDYAKWQYEYAMLKSNPQGSTDSYTKYFNPYQSYAGQAGTDWQEEIYGQTGQVQSHDLSVRGGSDKLSYNFGYALYDESSIMIGSNFRRNNLSLNLKNKATDKIDLAFTVRYSNTSIGGGGANDQKNDASAADSRLKNIVGYSPIPFNSGIDDAGDVSDEDRGSLVNPFVSVSDNDRLQKRTNFNMLGSFAWKVIKNMQFKSEFGLDTYNFLDYRYFGTSTTFSKNNSAHPALSIEDKKDTRFRNANTLNYDFKELIKSDNHNLKLLAGQEMIVYKSNVVSSDIINYPDSFTFDDTRYLTTQGDPLPIDNYYAPDDKLLSFFGRFNYDYKSRYLLTGTFRADGSSKFSDGNRWGYFPSVAAAWKISEESFLKDVSWIRALKIRVSYGEAGNNEIPPGQMLQTYGSKQTTYVNNVDSYWSASTVLFNPDLKWETTVTQNIGFDYDLFKGRVSGGFELYKNITKDLLINFPISGVGYTSQYRNMGEVQNTGVEATLNIAAIQSEDYGLSFAFNIGFNKNRINSLGVMNDYTAGSAWTSTMSNDYLVAVGQPLGIMNGYQNDGRYEVSDFKLDSNGAFIKAISGVNTGAYKYEGYVLKDGVPNNFVVAGPVLPGSMKLKDRNGDGVVDAKDIGIIGNANPKNTGGLVINAYIKNFDFMTAFNWSYGNDVYNANKIEYTTVTASSPNGQYKNLSSAMADGTRWTNMDSATGQLVTDPNALAALNANTTMWSPVGRFVFNDWAVEDASFLRLNTFTMGYTLPEVITSKFGISKLRFYQTMSNVFVITKYSGPDPEVSTRTKTPLTPGVDFSAYPRSRQIVFGLNLTF